MKKRTGSLGGRRGISLMFAIVGLCFVIFIAGCHGTAGNGAGDGIEAEDDGAAADDGKLSVICTLFPQYDFARYIGKGQADVTLLLSPGQEAHMYDPTPADMEAISDCDVFIYTGDAMEGWAAQIVDSLDNSVYVLDLSQYVTLREEEEDGHDHEEEHHHHGAYDPHYWLDMTNAAAMAQAIGDVLSNLDEGHSREYAERTGEYVGRLLDLDQAFMDTVHNSPRKDIVFGGRFAYSYFINRYGLEYETVYHTCSAESDPGVTDMIRVIDYIDQHDNSCIFYEELSSGNVAKTIARDANIDTAVFTTGHNVTKDEFDRGITFIDLMNDNLELLKHVLAQ